MSEVNKCKIFDSESLQHVRWNTECRPVVSVGLTLVSDRLRFRIREEGGSGLQSGTVFIFGS